jgi:hypothetical protein
MANRPVAFALTPALANREVLDFNDPADTKLFKAATEKLSIDYDCDLENLPLFLAQLRNRAAVYDWLTLLLIPKAGNEEMTKDLIKSYGELTILRIFAIPCFYDGMNESACKSLGEVQQIWWEMKQL